MYEPILGMVIHFSMDQVIKNGSKDVWIPCKGQFGYSRNPIDIRTIDSIGRDIFDVIGYTYGGDGKSFFQLPDTQELDGTGFEGRHLICIRGKKPEDVVEDEHYIAQMHLFSGPNPPEGWVFCDGQILNIRGEEALFSLIGNMPEEDQKGDGRTTFSLPDTRESDNALYGTHFGTTGLRHIIALEGYYPSRW